MDFTITLGWWLIPALLTVAAIVWCEKQDYSGDYNFTGVFTFPMTGFVICFVWMVYFALAWIFS